MEIKVLRKYRKVDYTIGELLINGKLVCNTLEDVDRGLRQEMSLAEIMTRKKYGVTAIPCGRYKVILSQSAKFGRVIPELLNVNGYKFVRIHAGNTAKDTLGCILVGENKEKGKVINSRKYEDLIVSELKKCKLKGENIYITIE